MQALSPARPLPVRQARPRGERPRLPLLSQVGTVCRAQPASAAQAPPVLQQHSGLRDALLSWVSELDSCGGPQARRRHDEACMAGGVEAVDWDMLPVGLASALLLLADNRWVRRPSAALPGR